MHSEARLSRCDQGHDRTCRTVYACGSLVLFDVHDVYASIYTYIGYVGSGSLGSLGFEA